MNIPEKIYLTSDENEAYVFTQKRSDNKGIEYTRTDDFIKKALKWYCLDCICNDTCSNTCYFKSTFKRYLEGDDNQLPPKFENAINPDGSTSENYRYRHFIRRMQDDFIEKAVEWLDHRGCLYIQYSEGGTSFNNKQFIENFKKAMKGE